MKKKLSAKETKTLKIFHLLFSFMWLGGAIALAVISFFITPNNPSEALIYARILDFIDIWMIVVGAMGAFFTGLIYSIWTNWGFYKHKWILVKWIIVIIQIAYGTFILGPWVEHNIQIAETMSSNLSNYPVYFENLTKISIGGTIQLFFLVFIVYLSVIKPWKKNKTKKM